jgi:dihydroflavonol-4-reductase
METTTSKGTVLVTGANGYVGSHCVKILLEQGYNVRGSVRNVKDEKKVGHLLEMDSTG